MLNQKLKQSVVSRLLPRVQCPAQYLGGELNAVVKDHRQVRGRLCLAFPDTYSIGMSHYGLQVLYAVMNQQPDWACERAFTPLPDMERLLRESGLPLYSLETFTPLREFDIVGFSLQYDLCLSNILNDPLVIAGGPGTANPEPLARFIDLFVAGDGELSLPELCDRYLALKSAGVERAELLARLGAELSYVYVPRWYRPVFENGRQVGVRPQRADLPERIEPAVVPDLEQVPLPTAPVVPYVECVQDRLTLEIMRGCPGRCRFCQSTTLKRPLRHRSVETILHAARESYRRTALAIDERLSVFRPAHALLAARVSAAGSEHLGAQPAHQRTIAHHHRSAQYRRWENRSATSISTKAAAGRLPRGFIG